jgi:hypothetical protein
MGLFGLKIGRDSAWIFLVCAVLMVSQLDFQGSGVSHDVGSPFCHFGIFLFYSFVLHQQFYLTPTFRSPG